jgi:hypothetical protein
MPSVDECRDLVERMDNLARMHGFRDFAELAMKIDVKSVDDALKLIEAIVLYRKCVEALNQSRV